MAYEFHYTPTGTGVISGKEVLEQTEDAINDLGNTAISGVQEALDKAEQALTNSENAVDDAQTALNTANNAEGVAIQAQNDVSNLSGTVTNIGNRVTTAEGNIGNLQGRMTTAEGNITNLQGRMTTAEGNIGNLQTAVSTAQATANSAQQTATTARQQSYVFRYSSTALTASSTNSNALLDNTDNLKVGDKVIDSSGVLFSITAIDTQNSTFTIGTALIDLAQDSDVVHKSGDETISGTKTFSATIRLTAYPNIRMYISDDEWNVQPETVKQAEIRFTDKNAVAVSYFVFQHRASSTEPFRTCWRQQKMDGTNGYYSIDFNNLGDFYPENDNAIGLGGSGNRWKSVYAVNYYYGSNNVEFSTKFVTTDTAQTISGAKTFSDTLTIYNSDDTQTPKGLVIRNAQWGMGESGGTTVSSINFLDKNSAIPASVMASKGFSGQSYLRFSVRTRDSQNNTYLEEIYYDIDTSGNVEFRSWHNNTISLGTPLYKWKDVQTNKVNGVEPSSLSLPSGNASDFIDISSYFSNTGSGDTNIYTAPANGWIYLYVTTCKTLTAYIQNADTLYSDYKERSNDGQIRMMLPIQKNNRFSTQWTTSTAVSITKAVFIPCQGNV